MLPKALTAGRRGSQIAEASLVYPLIIAVSIISIALMTHFSMCAEGSAAMCMDVRAMADESAQVVIRASDAEDPESFQNDSRENTEYDIKEYDIQESRGLLYKKLKGSYSAEFAVNGIFDISGGNVYSSERSCVSEADLIWKRQLLEDIAGGFAGND